MRRWKTLLAGVLLLLWGTYVAASEWPLPYYVQAKDEHPSVTWRDNTGNPETGMASILENTMGNAVLMRLSYKATGGEMPTLTYSGQRGLNIEVLKDDNVTHPFYLQASEPGDYEAGNPRFIVNVNAPVPGNTVFTSVTIVLINVNDNPPIIESPTSCEVKENLPGPTGCQFVVTDEDGGACYADMKVNDLHFGFRQITEQQRDCKTATYELEVTDPLDFETYRLHSLRITAEDNGRIGPGAEDVLIGYQETTVAFVVDVIDMPDVPPVWSIMVPSIAVEEKKEWTLELKAVDGDYGLDWPIKYELDLSELDPEFHKYFSIDLNTGLLTGLEMDRDELKREIFKIEVVATEVTDIAKFPDHVAESVSAGIVVMVNDINDNVPTIQPTTKVYEEFEEEHPFTSRDFQVLDPDLADNGTFHLELLPGDWSFNFMLIPASGYQSTWVTIASIDPSLLDYEDETWREIILEIKATEEAEPEHSTTAVLEIHLLDLLDEPPEFEQDEYPVLIEENQPMGVVVVQTNAFDPDEKDRIEFSLNNHPYMDIDDKGRITTKDNNAFDYERQTMMLLQVVVTDTTGLRAFCQVNIEVLDLNDEPPTIIMPYEKHDVDEHSPEGTRASPDISATDPDTEADLTFKIDWGESTAYKQGVEVTDRSLFEKTVDVMTAVEEDRIWKTHVIVADGFRFDWEKFDTLKLQISVIDIKTHPDYMHNEKRSAILNLPLDDVNDCIPEFTEESLSVNLTVTENADPNRYVGVVIATDDDSPPYSKITYSIEPVFPPELVEAADTPRITIREETGQLYTTVNKIDCDVWQTLIFQYKVFATDGKHTGYETITIYIEDTNDKFPDVTNPGPPHKLKANFEEHKSEPTKLVCIEGIDIDYTEEFHTITYYIEGDLEKYFKMEPKHCKRGKECCLWVIDGTELDREVEPYHLVEVLTRDNYEDESKSFSNVGPTTTVNVTLDDINDWPPEFLNQNQLFEVFEGKVEKGKDVFSVDVIDRDIGPNGEIKCEEIPKVTSEKYSEEVLVDLFKVRTDGHACYVYVTKLLVGLWGRYEFELKAWDQPGPEFDPMSGTGTYRLNVINENLNSPIIISPEEGAKPILIGWDNAVHSPLKDLRGEFLPDFITDDADDPTTANGVVTLSIIEGHDSYFYLDDGDNLNTFSLRMSTKPPQDRREFQMTLRASDNAAFPNNRSSDPRELLVYYLNRNALPEFTEKEKTVEFDENEDGLAQVRPLPKAKNYDEEHMDEDMQQDIYYHIIGGDTEYFKIDKLTNELTLKKKLDYEVASEHTLTIMASHREEPSTPTESNVLRVTIEVVDINDKPPKFVEDLFSGTFSADHEPGQKVVELKAIDPDTIDTVFYKMKPGTIKSDDPTLQEFVRDEAFTVALETGVVTLNFSPGGRALSGYFEFRVVAFDDAGDVDGHRDEATVNVFVVSAAHQVQFDFFNPVSTVEEKQNEMAKEFSEVFGHTCTVESVRRSNTQEDVETSEVLTHFIDNTYKSPVPREIIENEFLNSDTYKTLYERMANLQLSFTGFRNFVPESEPRKYMTIVLGTLSAVLAVLVVVFLLAFVVRTRTLNNRLEKLTSKKFGSQDSGLNRDSMAAPGTNLHAIQGSNPVWNRQIDNDYDNMSNSSGDSGLTGIEDSPEFGGTAGGVDNRAFDARASVNPFAMASAPLTAATFDPTPRRVSLNPLVAASAADAPGYGFTAEPGLFSLEQDVGFPGRISLNPLAAALDAELDSLDGDGDVDGDVEAPPARSNFSFQRGNEPSTEL